MKMGLSLTWMVLAFGTKGGALGKVESPLTTV